VGINVPDVDRFYRHFAVWDLEALLKPLPTNHNQNSATKFTHRHQAISFSVCSNVEGFTDPIAVVNTNPQHLVTDMFIYLERIRQKAVVLGYEKWGDAYDNLAHKIQHRKLQIERDLLGESETDSSDEEGSSDSDDRKEEQKLKKDPVYKNLVDLKDKFRQ
jgi:hypothetical protein